MSKRVISLALVFILLFSLFGCGSNDFTIGELTITLPSGYTERERPENMNMLLSDGKSTVSFRRISFIDAAALGIPTGLSDGEFAEYFLENSGVSGTISSYKSTPYYTYYKDEEGVSLFTLCAFIRTPYAYFIIVFATGKDREEVGRTEYFSSIESIKIEILE